MTRYITTALLLLTTLFAFTGCEKFWEFRETAQTQVQDTTEGIQELGEKIKETTESAKETVKDIENAAKEVGEAVDAIKEIGN